MASFPVTVKVKTSKQRKKALACPSKPGSITWCSGLVSRNTPTHTPTGIFAGTAVDVLLDTETEDCTEACAVGFPVAESENVEAGEVAVGSALGYLFTCQPFGSGELSPRGAVVLRAVSYHGKRLIVPTFSDSEDEEDLEGEQHTKEDKEDRASIFATWLISTFTEEVLCGGRGVMDVASGKGKLSLELIEQVGSGKLCCTMVEPVSRDEKMVSQDALLLNESFDESFIQRHSDLISDCSMIVGLHPDQATDAIVDTALRLHKPFAVVPCCVFPKLFPERRQTTGQAVRGYKGFVRYLRAKDFRIETSRLGFQGKDKVLFFRGGLGMCKVCDIID